MEELLGIVNLLIVVVIILIVVVFGLLVLLFIKDLLFGKKEEKTQEKKEPEIPVQAKLSSVEKNKTAEKVSSKEESDDKSAIELLKERYAKGEITSSDFKKMKKELEE